MTDDTARPLDVLVIESHQGAAAPASDILTAAGHRVHRCRDERSNGFPCRGVIDPDACPLAGPIDVALAVRWRIDPHITEIEQGVTCALRARVPLVESGPSALDPFAPWLTARVEGDVVATCEAAAGRATGARRPAGDLTAGPAGSGVRPPLAGEG
jgi:hypothetical protein